MAVRDRALGGPILGLIGGLLLIYGGIIAIFEMIQRQNLLALFGYTYADFEIDVLLFYLNFALTLVWGILALIAAILVIRGVSFAKNLLLVIGVLAVLGLFIPIQPAQRIDLGGGSYLLMPAINLSSSLVFLLDPFLVLLGGILVLILKKSIDKYSSFNRSIIILLLIILLVIFLFVMELVLQN